MRYPRLWMLSLLSGVLVACAGMNAPVRLYGGAAKPASDVAILAVPDGVQLLEVDGDEVGGSYLRDHYQAEILPGEHLLKIRYAELWQINAEEHDVVRSSPVLIRMNAKAGQKYGFTYERPKTREEARRFAKDVRISLREEGSGAQVAGISVAKGQLDGLGSGLFGGENSSASLERLKKLWSQAKDADRKAFLEWLKTPDAAQQP